MNPPTIDDVKDCIVTYHDQRNDMESHSPSKYCAVSEIEYRSATSYGSWFGQWWNISVHFIADIDHDGARQATRTKRIEMGLPGRSFAIREIIDEFPCVIVYAKPTGLIWPSFVYMDHLPTVLLLKGTYFLNRDHAI